VSKKLVAGLAIGIPAIIAVPLVLKSVGAIGGPKSPLQSARRCPSVGTPHPMAAPGYIWENLVIVACDEALRVKVYGYLDANGNIDPKSQWVLFADMPLGHYGSWYGNYTVETYPPGETNILKVLAAFKSQAENVKSIGIPKGLIEPQVVWIDMISKEIATKVTS
jgi:hypothetical protein